MNRAENVDYRSLPPDQVNYESLSPGTLVNLFAYVTHRNFAIRALVGGLTATELRQVKLTDSAFAAMVEGLEHPNPKVRWWCLQLFDHIGDERCIPHLIHALDDPVPRVRKMARHALECEQCKQSPLVAQAARRALAQHITQQDPVSGLRSPVSGLFSQEEPDWPLNDTPTY